MAPGARSKFGAPMFESEFFWEQIYCIEESVCGIVGTFRRPIVARLPGNCAPRGYSPDRGIIEPADARGVWKKIDLQQKLRGHAWNFLYNKTTVRWYLKANESLWTISCCKFCGQKRKTVYLSKKKIQPATNFGDNMKFIPQFFAQLSDAFHLLFTITIILEFHKVRDNNLLNQVLQRKVTFLQGDRFAHYYHAVGDYGVICDSKTTPSTVR